MIDNLTFAQVGDLAWKISEVSLANWVKIFNKFSLEHAIDIYQSLDNFSVLYGVQKPNRTIVVDLHHNPIEGNTNGGPRSNYDSLKNKFPMINNMGDFMYRLPLYVENNSTYVAEQTIKILHEVQHTFFQNAYFNAMVANVVSIPSVAKNLDSIFSQGGVAFRSYANEPVELITTYLENIVIFTNTTTKIASISPILFRADKDLQTALIEIEVTQYKQNPNGASAKFVKAWQKLLEEQLSISREVESEIKSSPEENRRLSKYQDVYQLGRALDPGLVYEYLNAKRPLDAYFVQRLTDMSAKLLLL